MSERSRPGGECKSGGNTMIIIIIPIVPILPIIPCLLEVFLGFMQTMVRWTYHVYLYHRHHAIEPITCASNEPVWDAQLVQVQPFGRRSKIIYHMMEAQETPESSRLQSFTTPVIKTWGICFNRRMMIER